jgi:hypothetical protein
MKLQNKLFLTFKKSEMLPYAYAYLNSYCPRNNGWEVLQSIEEINITPDFLVEHHNGKDLCRVAIMVKMNRKITAWHLRQMNLFESNSTSCPVQIEKVFIVPENCDTSLVPDDIKIIYLKEN